MLKTYNNNKEKNSKNNSVSELHKSDLKTNNLFDQIQTWTLMVLLIAERIVPTGLETTLQGTSATISIGKVSEILS